MGTEAVERWLAERIGLDPEAVGPGLIAKALHARLSTLGLGPDRAGEYDRLLLESAEEQEALIEEVVVSESWFFRDERPFQVFRDHVVGRGLGTPLRVLCIPCAGGEEPYSLAMTLLDLGLDRDDWLIVAVDVSARALQSAAAGVYRENAFRGRDLAFRARHFCRQERGFQIRPEVVEAVRLFKGNLLDPELLGLEPPFDVIFCRNLLIYLHADARRRALETLDRLLAPGGLLFLGHAEHPGEGETRFESAGDRGGFAFRRASGARRPSALAALPAEVARPVRAPAVLPAPARVPLPSKPPGARVPARSEAPVAVPSPSSRAGSPAPRSVPLLEVAAVLAGQGSNDQAAALCEQSLREAGPSAPAFFLLGMIRQASGDPGEAETCWQKTVYLDPHHDEALLALALLAERRGDPASAAGYRRRATRAHQRKGSP